MSSSDSISTRYLNVPKEICTHLHLIDGGHYGTITKISVFHLLSSPYSGCKGCGLVGAFEALLVSTGVVGLQISGVNLV